MLAATASFERVRPGCYDFMHREARALDIVRVRRSPALDRVEAWRAGFAHAGREPAQRIAHLVERAIKRQPIVIIRQP